MSLIDLAERGTLPDALIRLGIRRLCARRLHEERDGGIEAESARRAARIRMLRESPVAIETKAANEQHYELPPGFFQLCLGKRLKYSSCLFPRGDESLDQAEELMLAASCERAELRDGQRILELGCGWGSLTLWMAERYPNARITAVSNSAPQREHIEARCRERGFANVTVLTHDANTLELPAASFDRCVSVEMFEHMRNYQTLLARIASWLAPGGKLFVHVFCHKDLMYPFEVDGDDNWMGRYFFTGGLMPAADTLLHANGHHMLVASEPLKEARERIEGSGTQELAKEGTSLGYGFRLSVELLVGLLVGLGMGWAIDGWLGTRPWLMLIFMILGLGAGVLNVMRVTRQMEQLEASKKDQR